MAIITAETLRDRLIAILGDAIGVYATPQGNVPAARIHDQKLPRDWELIKNPAASAEVIIPVNPEIVPFAKNFQWTFFEHRWEVRIYLHELAQQFTGVLHCLIEKLEAEDLTVNYTKIPPSDMSAELYIVTIGQKLQQRR
jgi:hypothetical protein